MNREADNKSWIMVLNLTGGREMFAMSTKNTGKRMTLEELEDMRLLKLAEERLRNSSGKLYSQEEILESLGITQEELDAMEDAEI